MRAADSFRDAMRRAGLDYAGSIIADGKLHRFRAEGDHGQNGWYVLHADAPAAGAFGCWKRQINETWCERSDQQLSPTEREAFRRRMEQIEAERKRAEVERRDKARKVAAEILSRAEPPAGNGYLQRKVAKPFGEVRQRGDKLVVPLRDAAGTLHSLQFIEPGGSKMFLSGGQVAGCFFTLAERADGPLVIAEGYVTAASVHEATGLATVAAMDCGNLLAVAKALRAKWPAREIIIAADNDQWTAGNPGLTKAADAAKAIGARLAVPLFADTATRPTDFNDLAKLEGLNTVKTQIESAAPPKETTEETIARLAKLTPFEYDQCRDNESKRLGIRVATLDSEVARLRPRALGDTGQGSGIEFPDVEPWPEPVDGASLLDEIRDTMRRYIVAPDTVLVAAPLFALHTHAFDLGDVSPILFITGPTKRCGKSKLSSLMCRFVNRPLAVSSASAPGMYRVIELHHPTLLIDEVDAFMRGDEQLRGLVNSGHTRDAAFHLGCVAVGDNFEPRRWSTWTPKVFSGIGRLADTVEDRAIIVKMKRRHKGEHVERLRYKTRFDDLRRKCARFVADHADAIRNADPAIPEALNDRAADNWTPLLTLADLAGGHWPETARKAALELSGNGEDTESLGIGGQLLADIRRAFDEADADKLPSQDLCERLANMEGHPWAEWGKQRKPITKNQLAKPLAAFGVSSRDIRGEGGVKKGYLREDFDDVFDRYLPESGESKRDNATAPENPAGNEVFGNATKPACSVSENAVSAHENSPCSGVAFQKPEIGGETSKPTKELMEFVT